MLFNLTSEHLEMCLISKRILNSSADKGHKVLFGKLCINRTKVSWNQCWMFRLFTEAFRVSFLSFFCSTFRLYIFSRLHLQKKWFLPRSGVRSLLLAFKATKKSVKWRSCLDSDKNAQQRTKMCGNKGKPFKVRFRSLYYYSTTVFPFIWSHAGKFANKLQSVKATDEWPPTDNAF